MAALSGIIRTCRVNPRLSEAVESIARQTCRDFSVVLVNMGEAPALELVSWFSERLPALRHSIIGRRFITLTLLQQFNAIPFPKFGGLRIKNYNVESLVSEVGCKSLNRVLLGQQFD